MSAADLEAFEQYVADEIESIAALEAEADRLAEMAAGVTVEDSSLTARSNAR